MQPTDNVTDFSGAGVAEEFIRVSRQELVQNLNRIEICLQELESDQLWRREHEIENSIGNLVLHLCGNVRQWIISGIGGVEDQRQRDLEFSTRDSLSRKELLRRLVDTLQEADQVLADLPAGCLMEKRHIQIYEVTILHAIYHVIDHFAGHTGQIIWITKHTTGEDLGIYRDLDRKIKNRSVQSNP